LTVLSRRLRLRGLPGGGKRIIIRPPSLPESRPALFGGQLEIAAGILVETDLGP
jgi:hypothetical protein